MSNIMLYRFVIFQMFCVFEFEFEFWVLEGGYVCRKLWPLESTVYSLYLNGIVIASKFKQNEKALDL